jgi:hypothetical protein
MALSTAGCADLLHFQPSAAAQTTVAQETPILPPQETPLSISDVTGLPDHAPTATLEERLIETGISDVTQELPPSPTPQGPAGVGGSLSPASFIHDADILILKPGDYSMVTSPFRVSAYLEPDPNHLIDIRLVGEDGRPLLEKSVQVFPYEGTTFVTMVSLIEFEIDPGTIQAARLEISTTDEFGRPKALNSIQLILLTEGDPLRNYAESLKEKVVIQYPLDNTLIQGDTLLLSGLVKARSEKPLSVELIDEAGQVIGEGEAAVLLQGEGDYGFFATQVHYDVAEPTWARLVIRVPDARIPGTAYIKTRELLLYP